MRIPPRRIRNASPNLPTASSSAFDDRGLVKNRHHPHEDKPLSAQRECGSGGTEAVINAPTVQPLRKGLPDLYSDVLSPYSRLSFSWASAACRFRSAFAPSHLRNAIRRIRGRRIHYNEANGSQHHHGLSAVRASFSGDGGACV